MLRAQYSYSVLRNQYLEQYSEAGTWYPILGTWYSEAQYFEPGSQNPVLRSLVFRAWYSGTQYSE